MNPSPEISVIIPARNEERLIRSTLHHVANACQRYNLQSSVSSQACEIVVVDNNSSDRTADLVRQFKSPVPITLVHQAEPGAARARNQGRATAQGRVLVFVDADTFVPDSSIGRIAEHCQNEMVAGITLLGALEGGWRSRLWWNFWNAVRRLPLPRAKAMPACMFCTAQVFDQFGPFDERVAIGEEWPILAGLYRQSPELVIYDQEIVARSSSRRMDQLKFGYVRILLKYVWAILHFRGRIHYTDQIR